MKTADLRQNPMTRRTFSGGHLAGVILTTDWRKDFHLPPDILKRLSARSNYVKFTDEMEESLSSQRHLDKLNTPIVLRVRHVRDPGVPTPVSRLFCGREGGRQAGATARG